MSYFSTILSFFRKHPDDLAYHPAQAGNKMHIKSVLQCWKLFWNNCESFVFYPGPVLAFGYCHGLRGCGVFCLCVYQSLACPHDNSSPVQARILEIDWCWSSCQFWILFFYQSYLRCYVLYLMRPSLWILVRPSLVADRIGLLFWLNVSFAVNYQWTFRSIIDIAIYLFTSEDRYFLWTTAVPLCTCTVATPFGMHACTCQCYTRDPPVTQSATWVRSSLLDTTTVSSIHFVSNIYTPRTTKLLGVLYWFYSVRLSVRRLSARPSVPHPLCSAYSFYWIHIYQGLSRYFNRDVNLREATRHVHGTLSPNIWCDTILITKSKGSKSLDVTACWWKSFGLHDCIRNSILL